ncbi:uncharacterized protein LOC123670342 [Melitaea cinxia]|uniref:uncharacterized protein LOC123670342 n=1 Tax=Melitaea cinxia TaxID=113334 RepID=UPI001E27399C|nr:uncharacterized protein LOC123670342 [Melitaea cinxia]
MDNSRIHLVKVVLRPDDLALNGFLTVTVNIGLLGNFSKLEFQSSERRVQNGVKGPNMERAGRRAKAGSLSGLSGGLPGATPNVRRQRSLEWSGDRYSSSDEDRPQKPPQLDDRVFASLLAQATQQFDSEQRRKYGSENGEEMPRFISSPQRQASPFPLESTNRRFYRRNRNSKGEEIFNGESTGGTLSRRNRRTDDFSRETNGRGSRMCQMNGPSSGAQSERECDSPPEPAPPEVPPRGPSLHVTLRHRPAPDQPADSDRLFLSEARKLEMNVVTKKNDE